MAWLAGLKFHFNFLERRVGVVGLDRPIVQRQLHLVALRQAQ